MSNQLFISFSDALDPSMSAAYQEDRLLNTLNQALQIMSTKLENDRLSFAYFENAASYWHKPKVLDVYITDISEGQQLNLEARGKDYATNILSYPSDLPGELLQALPEIPLGELIICHQVLEKEAKEQNKLFEHHLAHLLVHGVLHLLGFDHEISDADADEMESFEIEILASLGMDNPYQD